MVHWRTIAPKIIKYALQQKDELLLKKRKNKSKRSSKSVTLSTSKDSLEDEENCEPLENSRTQEEDLSQGISRVDVNYLDLIDVLNKYKDVISTGLRKCWVILL